MKKYILQYIVALFVLLAASCSKQLDLTPISSISDASYWQNADQVDAFVTGVHVQFRSSNTNFEYLGELRSGNFGTDPGSSTAFTSEATQGFENTWKQTLTLDNAFVTNFGGFYVNINQLNLLIQKLKTTSLVTDAKKNQYLGIAYGMRAFYYYQLMRSWGKAIIKTDPTTVIDDISKLPLAASPEADVLALIKNDIDSSNNAFGSNYAFDNRPSIGKGFWSKSATQMLKADVYLWTAQRGGAAADATIALNALNDIQTNVTSLSLLPNFSDVFNTKRNAEVIFCSSNVLKESTIGFITNFVPQSGFIVNYYDSVKARKFATSYADGSTPENWGGILRAPTRIATFRAYNNLDSRKWVSVQPVYNYSSTTGIYTLAGCFLRKYTGEQDAGARSYTNDYITYRYADLLLMKAEAKVILGQSPAPEINAVRQRAYGANYVAATMGYPNQPIDAIPNDAILLERKLEFLGEGKYWYDLRRMGDNYVYKYTSLTAAESYKLLWPIDRATLTNNSKLEQTTGYPKN